MPAIEASRDRIIKLAAIGTAAGAFSGMFGAIVIVALLATALQGAYGNVDPLKALLVAVPALAGVVAGAELQQRLPERAISLIFAALLLVIAAELAIR